MKIQIVDASVAIKWFLPEKNSEASLAILKAIENNPTEFAVPELFFNEMLSVFCRLCRSGKEIVDNVHLLEELGLQRIGNGSELLGCAAKLAFDYKLSGYDAI
ncbi:MAG: type II toxin-antitoxin system VapC family toxin, partial [Deltaproteobacteria bacterium]|nr:type II toxin-antitoxin system VapC family toxin [Deltaproteobacteria bacterium]